MKLAHTRQGTGPPLVLIHGLGGSLRNWDPCLEHLSAERETICVDMPGFGNSEPLPQGRAASPAEFARAITNFLRSIGVERPAVAGNSLGGWTALEIGRQGGASAVIGLSPAGLWRQPLGDQTFDLRGVAKLLSPVIDRYARTDHGRRTLLRSIVAHPERVPPPAAAAMVRDWIHAPGYEAANDWMRKLIFEDPAEVTIPVTIGWGEHDRLVKKPHPERMPPQTDFRVLSGCGHTPTWDDPELISQLLLNGSAVQG